MRMDKHPFCEFHICEYCHADSPVLHRQARTTLRKNIDKIFSPTCWVMSYSQKFSLFSLKGPFKYFLVSGYPVWLVIVTPFLSNNHWTALTCPGWGSACSIASATCAPPSRQTAGPARSQYRPVCPAQLHHPLGRRPLAVPHQGRRRSSRRTVNTLSGNPDRCSVCKELNYSSPSTQIKRTFSIWLVSWSGS